MGVQSCVYGLRKDPNNTFKSLTELVLNNGAPLADADHTRKEVNGVFSFTEENAVLNPQQEERSLEAAVTKGLEQSNPERDQGVQTSLGDSAGLLILLDL